MGHTYEICLMIYGIDNIKNGAYQLYDMPHLYLKYDFIQSADECSYVLQQRLQHSRRASHIPE